MDMYHVPVLPVEGQHLGHCVVELFGAVASAEREDTDLVFLNSQFLPSLPAACEENFLPNRVSGDNRLALRQVLLGLRNRQKHLVYIAAQQLGSHAGKGVLFVRESGIAVLGGPAQQRTAGIAAGAYHHIGRKAAQYFPGTV